MKSKQLFTPNQFYIIRAERAGVFLAKIVNMEGSTAQVSSLRRLYYWNGALDVSHIAKEGVAASGNKFSTQMGDDDHSTLFNLVEFHPVSEKSLQTLNAVTPWKK